MTRSIYIILDNVIFSWYAIITHIKILVFSSYFIRRFSCCVMSFNSFGRMKMSFLIFRLLTPHFTLVSFKNVFQFKGKPIRFQGGYWNIVLYSVLIQTLIFIFFYIEYIKFRFFLNYQRSISSTSECMEYCGKHKLFYFSRTAYPGCL